MAGCAIKLDSYKRCLLPGNAAGHNQPGELRIKIPHEHSRHRDWRSAALSLILPLTQNDKLLCFLCLCWAWARRACVLCWQTQASQASSFISDVVVVDLLFILLSLLML